MLVAEAAQCLTGLAKGLRTHFKVPYTDFVLYRHLLPMGFVLCYFDSYVVPFEVRYGNYWHLSVTKF